MPALLLVLACALWGVSFPVIKALHLEQSARLPEVSSAYFAVWMQVARFGLGALLMLPMVLGRARPTVSELKQSAWLALWGGAGMGLQADALAETDAATSAFLTQAYCVILPLIACLRSRRAPDRRTLGATVLVVIGGAILSGVRPDHLRIGNGELKTLIASFIFTFQILTLENPKYAANRGLTVTFTMCAFIALFFLPLLLTMAPAATAIAAGASWQSWLLVLVLALFCSVGAYGIMNTWQPRVSATEAGLIYTIEPVFTAGFVTFLPALLTQLVGQAYPNQSLTLTLVGGGLLIVAANVLMQWKKPPHPPAIAPVP